MRKFNLMCLSLMAGATLAGCSDDTLMPTNPDAERYVRDFIERYGVPEAGHTFSMAKRNSITLKSSLPVDVKVYGEYGGKLYLFADWKAVSGSQEIPFDIPSNTENVVVEANGKSRVVKVGSVVDVDAPARAASRANPETVDVTKFKKEKIDICTTEEVKSVLDPASSGTEVYWGAVHPVTEAVSQNFYDNKDHPFKDANGGRIHYWHGHSQVIPASIMKQYVGTTAAFYNTDKFTDTGFDRVYTATGAVPSFYIHHVRKDLNYEFGIMIGDKLTLNESNRYLCIPMYTSKNLTDKNQIMKLARTAKDEDKEFSEYNGASFDFYFDLDTDNFGYKGKRHTWDFVEKTNDNGETSGGSLKDLKEKVQKVATLYTDHNGYRMLPLPIDLADAKNIRTDYPDKDNVVLYQENETGKAFYESYQKYLKWCLDNLDNDSKTAYYDELFCLKEFLGCNSYLMSKDDIPVVTHMKDDKGNEYSDRYIVTFPVAKFATGFAAATDGSSDGKLYTTMSSDYDVYKSVNGGLMVPVGDIDYRGHNFVYYIRNLDKDIDAAGGLITTATAKIKKTSPVKTGLSGNTGQYESGLLCWDLDEDGVYNDFVFTINATGAGGSGVDPFTWILACEDLGGTGDYDFNDLVVAVQYKSSNNASEEPVHIYPLAAGGIYPIYLMYNEKYSNAGTEVKRTYIVGKEMHEWLGSKNEGTELTMINTGDNFPHSSLLNYGHNVEFKYQSGFSNNHFADLMGDIKHDQNTTGDDNLSFAGFWVLVDKNNSVATHYADYKDAEGNKFEIKQDMNEIKDLEDFNNATADCNRVVYAAALHNNPAPMMMVLSMDWEWPSETKRISDVYSQWTDWLKDRNTIWYGQDASYKYIDYDRNNVTKRADVTTRIENSKK